MSLIDVKLVVQISQISTYDHVNGCVLQRNPAMWEHMSFLYYWRSYLLVILTDAGNNYFQESSVRGWAIIH